MKFNYLSIDEVIAIHDRMLKLAGGREGIRDFTLIHSAIERPKATFAEKDLYPTILLKAAAIIQSLIRSHPFDDGNKRTGYFSTLRFLNLNGYDLATSKREIIGFTVKIDVKRLQIEDVSSWLRKHSQKRT